MVLTAAAGGTTIFDAQAFLNFSTTPPAPVPGQTCCGSGADRGCTCSCSGYCIVRAATSNVCGARCTSPRTSLHRPHHVRKHASGRAWRLYACGERGRYERSMVALRCSARARYVEITTQCSWLCGTRRPRPWQQMPASISGACRSTSGVARRCRACGRSPGAARARPSFTWPCRITRWGGRRRW